jgi:hypothetical protein
VSISGPNLGRGINDGLELACMLMRELIVAAKFHAATQQLTCQVP